jgi:hypothetical protein
VSVWYLLRGPSSMHGGVRGPCPMLAVKLSCDDSLYRHSVCESAVACRFPVVVLDSLCVPLSHQVLDMEITIWRHWSALFVVHCYCV